MNLLSRLQLAWRAFTAGPAELKNSCGMQLHLKQRKWEDEEIRPAGQSCIPRTLGVGVSTQLHPGDFIEITEGPRPIEILKTGDSIGELSAVLQHPDGTVRRVTFDADRPVTVPAPFRVVQIGHIGSNVKLDSPNDSPGAMIANAMRRFNQNVMREPQFEASVYDETNSTADPVKMSTVDVAFGPKDGNRQRFQITIERTDREPAQMARRTPLVISEGE